VRALFCQNKVRLHVQNDYAKITYNYNQFISGAVKFFGHNLH